MIVVSNPGANLPPELIAAYDIVLTPQRIVCDSANIDVATLTSENDIDALVTSAKIHPHVLGTSASEFVQLIRDLAEKDSEFIVVTPSRKASGTYDAAIAASRVLQSMPLYSHVKMSVVDSATADVGTGLIALFCAASGRLGMERRQIAQAAEALAKTGVLGLVPTSFDYLMKSGRASFLKTMIATLLQKLPIIGCKEGELTPIGTMNKNDDIPKAIVAQLLKELGPGRAIWAGVAHGRNRESASELVQLLRESFDVRFVAERQLAPGIYLNLGPSVGAAVYPVGAFPWPLSL